MRKSPFFNLLFFFISILLFSCSSKKNTESTITGTILNLETNFIVLSKVDDVQKKINTIVDTLLIDTQGNFESQNLNVPNIYNFTLNSKKTIQLAIDKNQIVSISGNDSDHLTINGSEDTQLLLDYETFRKASLSRLVNSVRTKVSKLLKEKGSEKEIAALRSLEIENYKLHLNELSRYIQQNMGTSIAIYPTSIRWNEENLAIYEEIVAKFKIAHPNSEIASKLEDRVQLLQKMAPGSSVSNIEMPSSEGEMIQLNALKGTYTLIDFWASWCPPCRTESILLNELYLKYHTKGFEIYGISLDSKKERWIKALEKDHRIWPNVSALEGFKSPIAIEYGITALPTNLLIDAEGKIIASNIHGKHLKELVEKLFLD